METFAYIHAAVNYEDPNPAPELRSFDDIQLPNAALMGIAGAAAAVTVIGSNPDRAMAATPIVGQGSAGTEVEAVQKALGIEADGHFGPKTETAVTDFQIRQGLKQIDGVVGKETATALGLDEKYRKVGYVSTRSGIGLNIRSGPGLDYRIISGASNGAYLAQDYRRVESRDGFDWTPVAGGGWVAANYTDSGYYPYPGNDGYEQTVSYPGGSGGYVDTYSEIGLNVRRGPGLGYGVVGGYDEDDYVSTDAGDAVEADGYRWVRTAAGNWVASDYLY